MPYLLCTDEPPELELSGTPAELRTLGREIAAFAQSQESTLTLVLAELPDPTPYSRSVAALTLTRETGPTRVSIGENGHVHAVGSPENLKLLSEWLGIEDDTPDGYHVHYDGWRGNQYIAEGSVPLVITVQRRENVSRVGRSL